MVENVFKCVDKLLLKIPKTRAIMCQSYTRTSPILAASVTFQPGSTILCMLTHWGRVTHTCLSNLINGSDNGLAPDWRQAIIWTNVRILLIGPLRTNFSEILIKIHTFSFKKINLKHHLQNSGQLVSASMSYQGYEFVTVRCHYNEVQHNMILHRSLQWLRQNINLSFNTQKQTPHSLPSQVIYGISIVRKLTTA